MKSDESTLSRAEDEEEQEAPFVTTHQSNSILAQRAKPSDLISIESRQSAKRSVSNNKPIPLDVILGKKEARDEKDV